MNHSLIPARRSSLLEFHVDLPRGRFIGDVRYEGASLRGFHEPLIGSRAKGIASKALYGLCGIVEGASLRGFSRRVSDSLIPALGASLLKPCMQ